MTRLRKEGAIFLATFAGLAAFLSLDIIYVRTMGRFVFLTGIPTPGGASVEIHLINVGLRGAWAAVAYAAIMRLAFGKIHWLRLVVQWGAGLAVIALIVGLEQAGVLSLQVMHNTALGAYMLAGQLVFRDWVSR